MKNMTNTLIAVLSVIALSGYGFCSFFIEPKLDNSYSAFLESSKSERVMIPAVMYHLVVTDDTMLGEYVISPEEFEKDVLYLKENDYTPVFLSEVAEYKNGNGVLPEKPFIITFDDGYYNNYLNVLPIIKKHNVKINIAIIGKYTMQYSESGEISEAYSHLTYEHIKEMKDTNLVEFGNHTYNLHSITTFRKGVLKGVGETDKDYQALLYEDFHKNHQLIKEKSDVDLKYFAYPYGFSSQVAEDIVYNMGYDTVLCCDERLNTVSFGDKGILKISRFNRPYQKSLEQIIKKHS